MPAQPVKKSTQEHHWLPMELAHGVVLPCLERGNDSYVVKYTPREGFRSLLNPGDIVDVVNDRFHILDVQFDRVHGYAVITVEVIYHTTPVMPQLPPKKKTISG